MSTAQRQLQTQHSAHIGSTYMDIQNKHIHTTKANIEHIDIHIFIQYITNIKVENYQIYFNDSGFVPNMSTSLQTTLAAEAHLAEGQFLLEEQTLNIEKSLIYRTGIIIQFNSIQFLFIYVQT
jgi:hypothetical protein